MGAQPANDQQLTDRSAPTAELVMPPQHDVPDSPNPLTAVHDATGAQSSMAFSLPPQDLLSENLLFKAKRTQFNGQTVPSLCGLPLIAKLGQGGMGAVYYGVNPRLNIEVAVKVLPFHLVERNPEAVQRFFREAQLTAEIQSPHLVSVMDANKTRTKRMGFIF